MSYEAWRNEATRNVASVRIQEFLKHYRHGRPTVVLLPGGMGSRLDRSLDAYGRGGTPPREYDTVWADIGTLLARQALTLKIGRDGRDRDGHAIVANGPLEFLVKAYDGTERFFADPGVGFNYIVFGYDWRRPLAESAALLEDFLWQLRARVLDKHREDPLPDVTLFAHSQGGLVAKIFIHRVISNLHEWIKQLVTVGTPFYGTWAHQSRYFIGEPMLNFIYAGREMAPLIAALPGPYNLMFMSKGIYRENQQALGLTRYPMRTLDDDKDGADPYDVAGLERYPRWINRQHLHDAGEISKTLASPLPTEVARRVYNIRSSADKNTPVELTWDSLPNGFDPDRNPSPVQPGGRGLGDGTVPAWSAWHAGVPQENRIDLHQSLDHAFLMEDPRVLEIVKALICDGPIPEPKDVPPQPPAAAGSDEVKQLCEAIAMNEIGREDPRLEDPRMWRGVFRELMR